MNTNLNRIDGDTASTGTSFITLDLPCVEAARCYVTETELGMRLSPVVVPNKLKSSTVLATSSTSTTSTPASALKGFASGIGRRINNLSGKHGDAGQGNVSEVTNNTTIVAFTKQRRPSEEWYISIETSYILAPSKPGEDGDRRRQSLRRRHYLHHHHQARQQTETIERRDPIRVLQLRNCVSGEYLCSNETGEVSTCMSPEDKTTKWLMMTQAQYQQHQELHHHHHHQQQQQQHQLEDDLHQPRQQGGSRSRASSSSSASEWFVTASSSSGSFASSSPSSSSGRSESMENFEDEQDDNLNPRVSHLNMTNNQNYDRNKLTVDETFCGHRIILVSLHHTGRTLVYSEESESSSLPSVTSSHNNTQSASNRLVVSTAPDDIDSTSHRTKTRRRRHNTCILELEFTSGELCFISNPVVHRQIRCNLLGQLSMVHQFQGWEVFRFIELPTRRTTTRTDSKLDRDDDDYDGVGELAISSWVHHQYFLSSNSDGDVFMTSRGNNRSNVTERWRIRPCSPSSRPIRKSNPGVYIQSVAHGRYLSVGRHDKEALCTTTNPNDYALWHLDSAHSHVYYLTSLYHTPPELDIRKSTEADPISDVDVKQQEVRMATTNVSTLLYNNAKNLSYSFQGITSTISSTVSNLIPPDLHISSSRRGPFLSKNRRSWEEWKIERVAQSCNDATFDNLHGVGTVALFSTAHEKYLGCNSLGQVHTTTSKGSWCHWGMEQSPFGGVIFRSIEHKRLLAVDTNGALCTTPSESDHDGLLGDHDENEDSHARLGHQHSWRLDPRLPHATSANKVATLSAVGVAGIALTVAMPFAVLGAVEAIGMSVTQLGIGLSAEALAGAGIGAVIGVGALGTTSKIVDGKNDTDHLNTLNGSPQGKSLAPIGTSLQISPLQNQTAADGISLEEYRFRKYRPISSWRSW